MLYYESPGTKFKEIRNLHVLEKITQITNFKAKTFNTFKEILFLAFSKFDLAIRKVKVSINHGSTQVLDATCQVSSPSVHWFWRIEF